MQQTSSFGVIINGDGQNLFIFVVGKQFPTNICVKLLAQHVCQYWCNSSQFNSTYIWKPMTVSFLQLFNKYFSISKTLRALLYIKNLPWCSLKAAERLEQSLPKHENVQFTGYVTMIWWAQSRAKFKITSLTLLVLVAAITFELHLVWSTPI